MADPFILGDCVSGAFDGTTIIDAGGGTPWVSGPAKVVNDHVTIAHNYASQAFDNTWCFLTGIANYAPSLNDVTSNVSFDEITTPVPVINLPDALVAPDVALTVPNFPDNFVPGDLYEFDENAVGAPPVLTDVAPTINLPATPGDLEAEAPTNAPEVLEFPFPDAPSTSLPSVPSFENLNLPATPDFNIPEFTQDLPVAPADLVAPNLTFDFQEEAYSSQLMTSLTNELIDRIQNGGTGLNPYIEQAIWDRARNREDQNAIRSENQINVEQAAKGFSRPSGAHLAALDQLAQETQNKNADLSREIAIKQAEMEQQNIQFALQTSLALEQTYLQNWNQVQQRAFDVEKYIQDFAVQMYEIALKRYEVQVEIYKAYSQAFEARVRAELGKAEIFKTELEGQKLIGDINIQRVELYKAQLAGINQAVEIYKSEVQATQTKLKGESLKIQNFKSLVDVYATQVQAKASEYDMYANAVKGQMAKVDIYDSQVKAFVSRVNAYASRADVEIKRVDSDIQLEGLRLQEYLARLQAVVQTVEAESSVAQAQIEAFKGEAAAYTAIVGAEGTRLDAESKVYDLELRKAQYAA
ncbi:MAG: hypothetical protein KJO69_03780, partial [Gammaproteobacteria bacterium]|nr:hypothetical protein [Gammaproteobacteria bacterium]